VVGHQPSKHEALSSNPSTAKNVKKKKRQSTEMSWIPGGHGTPGPSFGILVEIRRRPLPHTIIILHIIRGVGRAGSGGKWPKQRIHM
jgi:hypothetical protein